jgi:S1-C subfamily serine protease
MSNHTISRPSAAVLLTSAGLLFAALSAGLPAQTEQVDQRVLEAEAKRVAVCEKVMPAVTAIFSRGGQGGGSGVVISKDGYALTNFHVVQGSGPVMQCGLPDGVLYDAVLVGLDKVGDVALIQLQPKKPGEKGYKAQEFPFAPMGDSDKLKAGDWSLAMGNPFLLATDFRPTVTCGLISGVHRYQYPAGTLLEYTDCIQIDTSINPGNSGGPLFNLDGELVGINGRGSFEKRGRVNSGVGYAISINQIKNFMGHLRAGLDTDHASLGASIESDTGEGTSAVSKMTVRSMLDDVDVERRGLKIDDELVSFAGRPMSSVNQYKNVLGLFPRGWRVPLVYRRNNEKHEILVRLMGVQRQEIDDGKPKPPQPQPPGPPQPPIPKSPASDLYKPKPGFANFKFNQMELERLLGALRKQGDFTSVAGDWTIEAKFKTAKSDSDAKLTFVEEKTKTVVGLDIGSVSYKLDDPLQVALNAKSDDGKADEAKRLFDPPGSGGFMTAMYMYRRLLTLGPKGFERNFSHGGHEPFYPPAADGKQPASLNDLRVDTEVLQGEHGRFVAKYYCSLKDQTMLGLEVTIDKDADPCEVYFSDYRKVDGRMLPHRIEVHNGDNVYGTFTVQSYKLAAAK